MWRLLTASLVLVAAVGCAPDAETPHHAENGPTVEKDEFLIGLSMCGRFWKVEFEELSPAERVFRAVWELEAEVNNGGFEQYFLNCSGDTAFAVAAALRTIGAPRMAAIAEEACSVFPGGTPARDQVGRQRELAGLSAAQKSRLDALNDRFFRYEDDLTELLHAYVMRNRDAIAGATTEPPWSIRK